MVEGLRMMPLLLRLRMRFRSHDPLAVFVPALQPATPIPGFLGFASPFFLNPPLLLPDPLRVPVIESDVGPLAVSVKRRTATACVLVRLHASFHSQPVPPAREIRAFPLRPPVV